MISIWWLPLIVFLSVIVGLSITAITSASNFADLHEKILQKNRIIADQSELIQSLKLTMKHIQEELMKRMAEHSSQPNNNNNSKLRS